MTDPPLHGRLSGERLVGVDASGTIAIVVGVVGAPTPMWGELLQQIEGRPPFITGLTASRRDGNPAEPPSQIEVRLGSPTYVSEALDWLAEAISETNERHDAHVLLLAEIFRESHASLEGWFANHGGQRMTDANPNLN